jgi:glycosyltransferase involved in cell wall biosynthesis
VSKWARDALIEWLPEAAEVPCCVIGNFVARMDPGRALEPLGDLVTVGNLELVKNHRYLLRVLAEAKRSGHAYTLDVFGGGPYRGDLEQLADALGVTDQVRFRGFRRDVRDFLPRYRAYVHAAYSEACPLAIVEAMAAGLPILAGHLETLTELFDEGVEGRFLPLDDAADAASTIIDLLEREPERAKAARAAKDRFAREFDADLLAPRLLSVLGTEPASWAAAAP